MQKFIAPLFSSKVLQYFRNVLTIRQLQMDLLKVVKVMKNTETLSSPDTLQVLLAGVSLISWSMLGFVSGMY